MDFSAIQFFLYLYYIRPQDWVPGIAGAHLVMIAMIWALTATLFRKKGFSFDLLLKTPHDWVMLAYFCWVVFMAPDMMGTFADAKSLFVFYIVTLLALSSWVRMERILKTWTYILLIVAALAVGIEFGIDLTGGAKHTADQGRLSINTWMLDNPNALGHTVIVAIPLAYFAFVWRRSSSAIIVFPLMALLAGGCVYYTQSKGAFLVGATTLVGSQIFGRPRITQIIIISLAVIFGSVAMAQLPRMNTLSRSDEGIQGRLMSWQCARDSMKMHPTGVGWKMYISHFMWQKQWIELATHGSYVQIGAALGYGGMYLYLGVLYCGFRTLFQARTRNDDEERVRRMLFCLLFSYTLSNWMIDRAYHTEFFVTAAAVAAFHRLSRQTRAEDARGEDDASEENAAFGTQALPSNLSPAGVPTGYAMAASSKEDASGDAGKIPTLYTRNDGIVSWKEDFTPQLAEEDQPRIWWNRLGFPDFAIIGILEWGVLKMWDYILKSF